MHADTTTVSKEGPSQCPKFQMAFVMFSPPPPSPLKHTQEHMDTHLKIHTRTHAGAYAWTHAHLHMYVWHTRVHMHTHTHPGSEATPAPSGVLFSLPQGSRDATAQKEKGVD